MTDSNVRNVFDYNELQHFSVPLDKLPEGSEIINKPFSFYQTYKVLVLSIIAAFAVLLTFIFVLLFYVQLVKRIRSNLEKAMNASAWPPMARTRSSGTWTCPR